MKRSRLLTRIVMILVAAACLISVPALSVENPWDADGSGGKGTGLPFDSTLLDAGGGNLQQVVTPAQPPTNDRTPGWFIRASIRVSFFLMEHFTEKTSKKAQLKKAAY